ncbi:AMP-binding protein [Nocardia australiensis]|uniref:AMP-binding protein n=1 Tax=Nocardia australiensis TaxID=2887191 RepID=UPI001D1472E8|nr:AMP-binding protein [Nocardia australiensis]
MFVPLTTQDFLYRGSLVYTERLGLADESSSGSAQASLGHLSYGELGQRVAALASSLEQEGIEPGDRVAIVSHNSARLLEMLYAVTMSGRVAVPVNFRLHPDEIRYIVDNSGAQTLVLDPELADSLSDVHCKRRMIFGDQYETEWIAAGDPTFEWPDIEETAPASINYTSGTTANPKGVVLTHRNLWINAVMMSLHYGLSERDVYLHTLPSFHVNGWGMPFACAGLGIPQVLLRKVDGCEILRRVAEYGVTVMCAAPAVVASVLDAAQQWEGEIPGRGQVRVICGGAPPPTRLVERMNTELGWEFGQIYGMTESSPLLVSNSVRVEDAALSITERAAKLVAGQGHPVLGVRLRESRGEILARGNGIMTEYWENPKASALAIQDGWLHTGDGGTVGPDGRVTISDRKKDVIITGGENVSSIEVEDALYQHPAVADVAVIGVPSTKWGETIKALVVLADGVAGVDGEELIAHCKSRLASYKAPTSVEFLESLPRTATGKIQKFRLRAPYWEGVSHDAPTSAVGNS